MNTYGMEPILDALTPKSQGKVTVRKGTMQESKVRLDGDSDLSDTWLVTGALPNGSRVLSFGWDGNLATVGEGAPRTHGHTIPQVTGLQDALIALAPESGSSGGNSWFQFSGGIQICTLSVAPNIEFSAKYGSVYLARYTWTFGKPFSASPVVSIGRFQWDTSASWGSVENSPSTTSVNLRGHDFYSRASGTCYIQAIAIGTY